MNQDIILRLESEMRKLSAEMNRLQNEVVRLSEDVSDVAVNTADIPRNVPQQHESTDEQLAVDSGALPGYLGSAYNSGVLQLGEEVVAGDITAAVENSGLRWQDAGDHCNLAHQAAPESGTDESATSGEAITDVTIDGYGHVVGVKSGKPWNDDPPYNQFPDGDADPHESPDFNTVVTNPDGYLSLYGAYTALSGGDGYRIAVLKGHPANGEDYHADLEWWNADSDAPSPTSYSIAKTPGVNEFQLYDFSSSTGEESIGEDALVLFKENDRLKYAGRDALASWIGEAENASLWYFIRLIDVNVGGTQYDDYTGLAGYVPVVVSDGTALSGHLELKSVGDIVTAAGGQSGTTTFTTADSKTVTVTDGIIKSIVYREIGMKMELAVEDAAELKKMLLGTKSAMIEQAKKAKEVCDLCNSRINRIDSILAAMDQSA